MEINFYRHQKIPLDFTSHVRNRELVSDENEIKFHNIKNF